MKISTGFFLTICPALLLGAGCVTTTPTNTVVTNTKTVDVQDSVNDYDDFLLSLPIDQVTGEPIYCLPNNQPRTLGVPAGYEDDWTTYQDAYFGIAYPPNFVVDTSLGNEYASFVSPDGNATFHVYSPQWDGSPDKLLVQTGETVAAESPTVSEAVSCVTQLGVSSTAKFEAQVITKSSSDALRSIANLGLETEDDTSNVRMTFALEVKDAKYFDEYLEQFQLFMSSLVQYADA